ncbi:unnamed protein product [Paramecium pentaurelia]|uniref:Uncharacterized protein n=1 Tax=Paramecium pentaurelia TaxID=43138 RepID=A0A8S1SCE4_9CILI|nr:unnamed protein product [Paramecium pentaurelia]
MAELEYPQFLFEKHNENKFYKYEEIQNHKGFRLPDQQNDTIYLLDQDGGWCDLNGCYYNSQSQPSGWILLSKDGKKYIKFNMDADFITEQPNIYYSNLTFDAAHSQQYKQLHQNNNKDQFIENQQQEDHQKKLKEYKSNQKEIKGKKDKIYVTSEKAKDKKQIENQIQNNKCVEKTDNQVELLRNNRDKKKNDRRSKNNKKDDQNQNNNQTKKYYILNIEENTLSNEDFIKYLIEESKIKKEFIIDYNENILKLVQEKDAIKLYRVNKKEQINKVQKFIVSI